MSVFGLFMMAAMSGQSMTHLTFVTPALADQKADDMEAAKLAQTEADKVQKEADQAKSDAVQAQKEAEDAAATAKELGTEEAKDAAKEAKKKADNAKELANKDTKKAQETAKAAKDAMDLAEAFHCVSGIVSCYGADGEQGIPDLNSFAPTAAGSGGTTGTTGSDVKPRHFRSF